MKNSPSFCIIPVRGGSKGIPRKNMADFNGVSLLEWTIKQAAEIYSPEQIIVSTCVKAGIAVNELKGGSRRAEVSKVRRRLTVQLIEKHGLTPAEVARQLGVTSSAITKTIHRVKDSRYG